MDEFYAFQKNSQAIDEEMPKMMSLALDIY
jgi:hypothetical protein